MTSESLLNLTSRFGQVRVLVVGDPILDEYVTGDCTRLSPEAPIPVLRVSGTRSVLGGAANTAANVSSLGGQAVLVGIVGSDDAGRRLIDLCAARGVTTAIVGDARPTSRKVRALGGQQQLLRLDYEDDTPASPALVESALEQVRLHMKGTTVVVVSDYAKGLVNPAFCREVLALARREGVPVVIDPRPQHGDAYVGCDYLTPNWKEAQALLGDVETPPSTEAVRDVGHRLATRFGANVLLTLGAHGIRYFGRDGAQVFDEPAKAREVFDVSGAGDTVVAAFAMAIGAGADVQTSLRVANLAAGVVVAKVGTATVSSAELTQQADGRLVDPKGSAQLIGELRRQGRTIAAVIGPAGALRSAHLRLMSDARRRGDIVVACLAGAGAAEHSDHVALALGLRDIDFVCVVDDVSGFLEALRPRVRIDSSAPDSEENTDHD
jgi:D-beta-D-heptose 7-phosphate kinase/D-beta-D-heptose 1-phosphate adenosyltransferase